MRLRPLAPLSLAAAASLALACARDNAETGGFTGGGSQPSTSTADSSSSGSSGDTSTSSSGSTSTSSSGSTSTSDDSASTATATAGTWDVGTSPDFEPTIGCQGKIDFLFVISSHFEMLEFQDRLKAAFPAFVDLLRQDLADFDYQIMVVDAGTNALLNGCDDCYMMCGGCQVPGCPEDYPCDGQFVECDITEGAGVTITGNFGASNKRCDLATEHRYITTADDATLEESFACIATLGEGPKTPVSAQAMVAAVQPEILSTGCNAGVVRHDALLVVVVVQAGQDNLSPGTPASWYDALVTVKNGNEEAVVVLVISDDTELPDSVCNSQTPGKNTLMAFANTAAHGRFLSVCEGDYGPFLKEGAALALDQCAILVPQ